MDRKLRRAPSESRTTPAATAHTPPRRRHLARRLGGAVALALAVGCGGGKGAGSMDGGPPVSTATGEDAFTALTQDPSGQALAQAYREHEPTDEELKKGALVWAVL